MVLGYHPGAKQHLTGAQLGLAGAVSGVLQAVRSVFVEEGLTALWKGHVPAQALSLIYGAVQFSTFERLTRLASEHQYHVTSPGVHFICGAGAGIAASVASHPVDVIRTRLIAQGEPKTYTGICHAFTSLVRHEGPLALFRGLTPSVLLIAPQIGAMFAFYQMFTDLWHHIVPPGTMEAPFLCGALAGVCSKTLVYPLDLSKKRLQVRGFEHARTGFGQGVMALFKGLWPSVIKAAVTTGLHLSVYEHTCRLLLLVSSHHDPE
ncbi:hypothetical protein B566_EDAN006845 [Ephemera danica]|nr:hypothetical protein B566_EDAN006845 [Ephemera danica]